MVLNTSASISFSQLNSTVFFTNGNLGVNTTSPTVNLDVNGTINVSGNSSLANVTTTNITASNLISTSVSSGILSATNVIGNSITTSTLYSTTITASNLSLSGNVNIGGTLTTVNITSTNLKNTNISSATLNVSGLSSLANITTTNISTNGLIVDNITTGSINGTTLDGSSNSMTCTNISVANIYSSSGTITTASILASGLSNLSSVPISSSNISTGTLNVTGTSILANTTATNVSVGTIIASTGITTGTIRATGISTLANTTVTNISTGGVNASGLAVVANTTITNTSTGGLNATGLSTLLNTTATNISAAVLIASTGVTTGSIRTTNLNIGSTTIPYININSANTSNINISTNNLRLTQIGCPINHYTTSTSASYMTYQQNSGAVTGIIGLDGVGYSGAITGSFAISTWTAHPINFLTNGVNRMIINSSGNIGIGTTSPGYLLEVNGGIRTTGMTVANINLSGGSLVLRNTGHTSGLSFGDNNNSAAFSKIYDDGQMRLWTDDNMYFDIGTQFTSASTKMFINSTGVGIGGTTSPAYPISINTTTDSPGINPDACNSLLVSEDMQGTTVRSGTLAGANVSYSQNNYVQLTPGNGAGEFGQWYWNMNPGNAFTTDYEVSVTNTADGHKFFWGSDAAPSTTEGYNGSPTGYSVYFDEWNGAIKLFYNGSELTAVYSLNLRNSNWVKIRIVYQRNVVRVYYNGALQINYKDTARHLNYSNSYMGFTAACGGQYSAHRVRDVRIQKLIEGVWTHTSQTSGNIMFPAGNIGINTSVPAYTLDVNGTIARSGVRFPVFNNGTFSGASTAVIPILFSDTNYNYVDVKLKFILSNNGGTNVTLIGNTANAGNGTTLSLGEYGETTTRWGNVTAYTNSGLVATTCEGNSNENFFTIRIIRSSGTGVAGNRNHYQFDTSYIWSGVGAARAYGQGWIGNTSVGGTPLGSIILTCATGTISGKYSTQHSY